jgi:hypothetical protein
MPKQDADIFEVVISQMRECRNTNPVLGKALRMATQIRRDLYADVTSRKRPAEAMQSLDWPTPTRGRPMVEGKRNVSRASTKYWVDVILATSWQCQRFDSESEALA